MSDIAKSLLHYASNYRDSLVADDTDHEFCFHAARTYAAYIIAS
jgi:hypothetical protein